MSDRRNLMYGPPAGRVVVEGVRFRLDEDRIREFLMGESLYGDPSLAVRELYQNALDACRLADARRRFLGESVQRGETDPPDILIEQGVDAEGHPYIDCTDRGAGMGPHELTQSFCQAGVRASDCADREVEEADFAAADPPVELWQSSRFGIGVMSYFMIADAVTVSTARLERDGTVGDLLTMHIPRPASSFDVIHQGPASSAGTRVRLWLKPEVQVSAVSTLRDVVIVCPARMSAEDHRGMLHRWRPGELNHGSSHLSGVSDAVPGSPGLWWVGEMGAVLADGVWVNEWLFGMVVNLCGADTPRLTADRRSITRMDWAAVERLADAGAASAAQDAWHLVGRPGWISRVTGTVPRAADAIVAAAAARVDRALPLRGSRLDLSVSGFMPGDEEWRPRDEERSVESWRFSRFAAAGWFEAIGVSGGAEPIVAARPSDVVLVDSTVTFWRKGMTQSVGPWSNSVACLYDAERILGYPLEHIVHRARQLGLPLPQGADALPPSSAIVRTALSFSGRVDAEGSFRPLSLFDLLQTTWSTDLLIEDVVSELDLRSIEHADLPADALRGALRTPLLAAISRQGNGIAPWLSIDEEVGLDRIMRVAETTHEDPAAIIAGLKEWGFCNIPRLSLTGLTVTREDLVMLSRDLDGMAPFRDRGDHFSEEHLARAATELGRTSEQLLERFAEFGITLSRSQPQIDIDDLSRKQLLRRLGIRGEERRRLPLRVLRLVSRDDDGHPPWWNPDQPIPAWHIATLALHRQNRGTTEALDDLLADFHRLHYRVEDPRTAAVIARPGDASATR